MEINQLSLLANAGNIIGTSSLPSGAIDPGEIDTRISTAITVVLSLVVVMCVFYIIQGGVNYVNAGGDPNKVKTAQSTVTNAIIGLAVAFSSYAILRIVAYALGITDLSFHL